MIWLAIFIYLQIGFGLAFGTDLAAKEAARERLGWGEWVLCLLFWPAALAAVLGSYLEEWDNG